MVITLEGADFSQNNLGKIEVKKELSQFTKGILTHMTRYNVDTSEAFAIDRFYSNLLRTGIWGKLGRLYLPILAASEDQMFYDILKNDGTIDFTNRASDRVVMDVLTGGVMLGSSQVARPKDMAVTLVSPCEYDNRTTFAFTIGGVKNGRKNGQQVFESTNAIISSDINNYPYQMLSFDAGYDGRFISSMYPKEEFPYARVFITAKNSGFTALTRDKAKRVCVGYAQNERKVNEEGWIESTLPTQFGPSDKFYLFTEPWKDRTAGDKITVATKAIFGCIGFTKVALSDDETWRLNDELDKLMKSLGKEFTARAEFVVG